MFGIIFHFLFGLFLGDTAVKVKNAFHTIDRVCPLRSFMCGPKEYFLNS